MVTHLEPRVQTKLDHFRCLYEEVLRTREQPYERENKIMDVQKRISTLQDTQRELQIADASASHSYSSISTELERVIAKRVELREKFSVIFNNLLLMVPELKPSTLLEAALEEPRRPADVKPDMENGPTKEFNIQGRMRIPRFSGVRRARYEGTTPTSARVGSHLEAKQRRMGVNVSGSEQSISIDRERIMGHGDTGAVGNVILECFVCHGLQDQHLITKCDTCGKAFHLVCLDPPMLRMPKRSRLYGWQCSYCTKAVASNTEVIHVDVDAPRQLRRSFGRVSDRGVAPDTISHSAAPCSPATTIHSIHSMVSSSEPPAKLQPSLIPKLEPLPSVASVVVGPRLETQRIQPTSPRQRARFKLSGHSRVKTKCVNPFGTAGIRSNLGGGRARRRLLGSQTKGVGSRMARVSETTADKSSRGGKKTSARSLGGDSRRNKPTSSSTDPSRQSSGSYQSPEAVKKEPGKFDAYEYSAEPNSDEEIARLRKSKVVKFVQIRDHNQNSESESVEQIAPLRMRYMICTDHADNSPKRSTAGRFRMKLKKL